MPQTASDAVPSPTDTPDPSRLMQGFPPPPSQRVHIGNWQHHPQKIWSFRHTRELFPTKGLTPGKEVSVLRSAPGALDDLQVGGPDAPMTWPELLVSTHCDAALVLHRGQVVDERYFNGMQPHEPHLLFSATKSLVGLMGATLVAEGQLDPQAPVAELLPELAGSAWADARVQQVLDMTDGVRFTEVYTDPSSDIFAYIAAMGWVPPEYRREGDPFGIQAMLPTLKHRHEEAPGTAFRYRSPATDVAAWLASRAAGQSLTAWMQERLWTPMGMEHEGHVMLDPAGTEVAFAGMSASLRDLARLGQMLLQRGQWQGRQIIPTRVVETLEQGGSQAAFLTAEMPHRPGWSYRNQWWMVHDQPRAYAATGAYGQRLFVFPDDDTVVALFGSHPTPVAALVDPPHRQALKALVAHLNRH